MICLCFFQPSTVFISCIDCRVLSNNITQPASGEVFFAQNAGNMVPHFEVSNLREDMGLQMCVNTVKYIFKNIDLT